MNPEEKQLITQFFARVGGGQGVRAPLPPIDPQADQYIAQEFQRYPEARYRVTQLAVVQETALQQAQNKIRQLEYQVQQMQGEIVRLQAQQGQGRSGGFFSGLFGGGNRQAAPPPPGWGPVQGGYGPAPAPGYMSPGMFPRQGSGFLGSALTTAAGVAGGMMAANALEGLFSGPHGGSFHEAPGGFMAGDAGGMTGAAEGEDPFGGAGTSDSGFSSDDFGGDDFDGGGFGDDSFF